MGKLIAAVIGVLAGIVGVGIFFAIIAVLILNKCLQDDWLY